MSMARTILTHLFARQCNLFDVASVALLVFPNFMAGHVLLGLGWLLGVFFTSCCGELALDYVRDRRP